ncbi:MAG: poly-gamma-glutamate hydrolase family protein [Enhygromyxa sp.]
MPKSYDDFSRRDFLKALGVAALPVLTHGCDFDSSSSSSSSSETFRARPQGAGKGWGKGKDKNKPAPEPALTSAEVVVGRALTTQTLINNRQLCSLPGTLSKLCGIGRQLRITRPDYGSAIYTLHEYRPDDDPDLVRMNLYARLRLDTSDSFEGIVSNQVTATGLSDAEAQAQSEFVERLVDDGKNNGLVVLAPHGGAIELRTDQQAEHLTQLLGASSWICKGWRQGGGAFDAWHVPSTFLHPDSFPGLAAIAKRGFAYAVSFHGIAGTTGGVLVGGGASLELKQQVALAIRKAIGDTTIPVGIASPTDVYDGDAETNVVNWLTAEGHGGIQIEQDRRVRDDYGLTVAKAIAQVFAPLL